MGSEAADDWLGVMAQGEVKRGIEGYKGSPFVFREMNFARRSAFMLTFAGHVQLANPFPCCRVTCYGTAVAASA